MKDKIQNLLKKLSQDLPEREEVIKMGILALLARESLFLLGPPGTAKSLTARRLKYAFLGAKSFEYLMGRFSTPEEIFGPFSIAGLRDRDVFERQTAGYLPEADLAFLDEIWRASPPIQNALLNILNERIFRNGSQEIHVPLKGILGASNKLPEAEESAEAFWDRFLIRLSVANLESSEHFKTLILNTGDPYQNPLNPEEQITAVESDQVEMAQREVLLDSRTLEALTHLREEIQKKTTHAVEPGVLDLYVSDRRWKKITKLLRVSAWLHGRDSTDIMDLFLAIPCLWNHRDQLPDMENLVCATVETYGYLTVQPMDKLKSRSVELERAWKDLTGEAKTVQRRRPLLTGGEYYTLEEKEGPVQRRLWGEDFELLSRDEDQEVEVYYFADDGEMLESRLVLARKGAQEAQVLLAGQLHDLLHRVEPEEVRIAKTPDPQALNAWVKETQKALQDLKKTRQALEKERADRLSGAQNHLFVWSGYAEIPLVPLGLAQDEINQLLVKYQLLLEQAQELS